MMQHRTKFTFSARIILLSGLMVSVLGKSFAQQDPLYAQYFNNPILINPAFAGTNERLLLSTAYRSQWTGIDGGPVTYDFNGHIALVDNKVGAGVIFQQDKFGDFRTTKYESVFSYRIKLKESVFSFGMQFGFNQFATNLDGVYVLNSDQCFTPYSITKFNTGAGLLLKGERYVVGLSVPSLISNSAMIGDENVRLYSQNYYAYGSYAIPVKAGLDLKPSALVRLTNGSTSVDFNLNATFDLYYTLGLYTRNFNTGGIMLQGVFKNARLTYSFEIPMKGAALNYDTHEIGLAFSLAVLNKHDKLVNGF